MPASLRMTRPLLEHIADVASSLRAARHILLCLDFDGTLAPIVENPTEARMPAVARQALLRLSNHPKFSLAIISGRALADLRERVGLEGLIYAGNHGLEIKGPDVDFIEPLAAQRLKALGELSRHLRSRLRDIPGVEVENKVLSASVHFRKSPAGSLDQIRQTLDELFPFAGNPFEVTQGRKVFEIRPHVNWDKGAAVRWIKRSSGNPDALAVYVGDDSTDEDAFLALPEDITISVGRAPETSAEYYLERQESVPEFLTWLADFGDQPQARTTCRPRSN